MTESEIAALAALEAKWREAQKAFAEELQFGAKEHHVEQARDRLREAKQERDREVDARLPSLLADARRALALEAALREYGGHRADCEWGRTGYPGTSRCTCGFDAALASAREARHG